MNDMPARGQGMTPQAFIDRWKSAKLTERAAAQSHFIDLCRLLDEPTPVEVDPTGSTYSFEKGAMKTGGGGGWADVWKRGHFAWEYKRKHADLDAAFAQLQRYAIALENPPLLIVSDMHRFVIHTNWTNTVQEVHEIALEELLDARRRQLLKYAFSDPKQLKPRKTRQALTEEVAAGFARLAQHLRERGNDPQVVAHFVNRLVFCMFAEDVNLLPNKMFTKMLEVSLWDPEQFEDHSRMLFAAMRKGGPVGFDRVEWFNGGLFDDDETLPLAREDIKMTLDVARMDWSNIDPSIMGTLFERGLDPGKRSQLGAHYTDRDKIMLIVGPVIVEPLTREWEEIRARIEALADERNACDAEIAAIQAAAKAELERDREAAKAGEQNRRNRITSLKSRSTKAQSAAEKAREDFIERLRNFRILDPACGSGNFLYLSLLALKDLEHRANLDAEALDLPRLPPRVGPECVKGIEINPFAAELARVSVWIGEIQWMQRNGFDASRNPILKPLDTIECRDALLNEDGSEAEWPPGDVIVGNPPFLGGRKLRPELGDVYVGRLRKAFNGRLREGADLVCYWFDKANRQIITCNADYAGLVATNSISGRTNRDVLASIAAANEIFQVWDDEPWTVEGAAVRVALVCFARTVSESDIRLNGKTASHIFPDLTARFGVAGVDLSLAKIVSENKGIAFQGVVPRGEVNRREKRERGLPDATFLMPAEIAQRMLSLPTNPNGRPNSDVVRPYIIGDEIATRSLNRYIVDFSGMSEVEAALYEAPFDYLKPVKLHRAVMNQPEALKFWWRHWNARPNMREKLSHLDRYIATPRVSKHRLFVWQPTAVLPDCQVVAIARADDVTFGILHSRFHELWTLRMCTYLGVGNDPRYTPSTTFDTFCFPNRLTLDLPATQYADDPRAQAIAEAARRLNELRENWLNPEDLVQRVPEVVEGYPDRIVPVDDKAAAILRKRTLTNLYNERPAWLDHAHKALDEAVAAAYGWPADISDEQVLHELLSLNIKRGAGREH